VSVFYSASKTSNLILLSHNLYSIPYVISLFNADFIGGNTYVTTAIIIHCCRRHRLWPIHHLLNLVSFNAEKEV